MVKLPSWGLEGKNFIIANEQRIPIDLVAKNFSLNSILICNECTFLPVHHRGPTSSHHGPNATITVQNG